jgi:RNA polymerase primary sigma factor
VGPSAIAPAPPSRTGSRPTPGLDDNDRMRSGTPDGMGWYLDRVRGHPLLTAEEERQLGRCIERGRQAHEMLMDPACPAGERSALHRDVCLAADARQQFVQCNLRLVISIARRHASPQFPLPDCIQEGNLGLMEAVERFDWRRGFRFSTYGAWWIRQGILRALTDKARAVRLPSNVAHRVRRVQRVTDALTSDLRRSPSLEEIAAACDMPLDELAATLEAGAGPVSIFAEVGAAGFLGEFIEDTDEMDPSHAVDLLLRQRALNVALSALTPQELDVITLRFGFDTGSPRTLVDVSRALNLPPPAIRLLEEQAILKLRRSPLAPRFVP